MRCSPLSDRTLAVRALPTVLALGALLPAASATGQGVITAAVEGAVRSDDGAALGGASVVVVNVSNGRRWQVLTSATGRYMLEEVGIGGPYMIEVRALGYAGAVKDGIVLALGQRFVADFTLRPDPLELRELTVTADRVLEAGRTGPADVASSTTITALPNPGRDFLTLTLLSPHARFSPSAAGAPSGGISIGGQNRVYNSFRIDGGANHDLYHGRLPGRETLPRPISLEALEEIRVLAAPFDVRHGGFAGGLVSAVTKSGTNAVRGALFGYLARGALGGSGPAGDRPGFTAWQFGGAVGGPIMRDRAHYFLSIDLERRVLPDPGALIPDTAPGAELQPIGISHAGAARFQEILRATYGLDPGSTAPVDERLPARDVFGKVTVQPGINSHLEASHRYAHGDRRPLVLRGFGFYELTSAATQNPSTVHTSRLIWSRAFGGHWSNQLIVSYLRLSDRCEPSVQYPRISVVADLGSLWAGPPLGCAGAVVEQTALEMTDNVTVAVGRHAFGFGVHGELLHFTDGGDGLSAGFWSFSDLDALQAGRARRYERALPGPSGSTLIEFRVRHLGLYLQDRWRPGRHLVLTAGLRLDAHVMPDATSGHEAIAASLGVETGRPPRSILHWSPRLGFNYDVAGDGRAILRGGVGLFVGRPPYRWLGNAYRDDGTQALILVCDGADAPPFDPRVQPSTCGAGPTPRLSFVDPDFKLPQNLKAAVGVDRMLPAGIVAIADVLYTHAVNQPYLTDANLLPPIGTAAGEAGRPLYGTIDARGLPAPARRDPGFEAVTHLSNRSGDRALTLSAQLRKRLGEDSEIGALYAHGRARDRMSILSYAAGSNLHGTPLDGTLDDRRPATSYFETRHRVALHATLPLPYDTRLVLLYTGATGTPFSYVIDGDANADGVGRTSGKNDLVYIPRVSAAGGDVSLVVPDDDGGWAPASPAEYARLEAFIQDEHCLHAQRGRILARNSCRNPWSGALNARATKSVWASAARSLDINADIYNLPNLLNGRWGRARLTTPRSSITMLRLVGYDADAGRGIYQLTLPGRNQIQDAASRWQLEVSARYRF